MISLRKILAISVILCGCHHTASSSKDNRLNDDMPIPEDLSSLRDSANGYASLTLGSFLDQDGYVVGLDGFDAMPIGQGDGALRTALSIPSLDCNAGEALLQTLLKSINDNGGMIPRHNPLVASANGPTSRDQVAGVMLALVDRWNRCPDDHAAITAAWDRHVQYVVTNGRLGPTSDGDMLTLRWLWGAVGQLFGASGAGGGSKQEWEAGLPSTALAIKINRSACYPVHIGTVELVTAAKIGQAASTTTRKSFCDVTYGMNLALTDWYCERLKAADWLGAFVPNIWQIQFQRCSAWESPDGGSAKWPPVDFLELYALAKRND